MIKVFSGENANDVWINALAVLKNKKITKSSPSRAGDNSELLHAVFDISNPRQRWVVSRNPPLNPAFALAELVWIVNGCRESEVINFWNPVLPKYAGKGDIYHGAYGYRLRMHFGFDQLEKAYLSLKNNPSGRQNILLIWDPNSDFPNKLGYPVSEDIPCNICSLLKIRDKRLEWTQIIRSNDIFLGLPYNFVQFTGLQEVLAGWLDVELGSYVQFSDSLHLYNRDEYIDTLSENMLNNVDSIALPKHESERLFILIYEKMKLISCKLQSKREFMNCAYFDTGNEAFNNIMLVLAADAARRKGWITECSKIIEKCKNPIYRQMWSNWLERNKKK